MITIINTFFFGFLTAISVSLHCNYSFSWLTNFCSLCANYRCMILIDNFSSEAETEAGNFILKTTLV